MGNGNGEPAFPPGVAKQTDFLTRLVSLRFARHPRCLPVLMVLLGTACSTRSCGPSAHSQPDSGAVAMARPDAAPDLGPLEWSSGDLPGKGWHCYSWSSHYDEPPRYAGGRYCTRTLAECLRREPDSVGDVTAIDRKEACPKIHDRAYCYKKRPEWDGSIRIHCFKEMYECKSARRMSCRPVTECREFE